jgi:hypothetical protein
MWIIVEGMQYNINGIDLMAISLQIIVVQAS